MENCIHCDTSSVAFRYILEETDNFYIIADAHPLIEGHILIILKQHITCVGAFDEKLFNAFLKLDIKVKQFIKKNYGNVASFEHGIYGQTVFHCHVHYLPFNGNKEDIVPEGKDKLIAINDISVLKKLLQQENGYLYFAINNEKWVVDVSLAVPRFFRDRFAKALNAGNRADWKSMEQDKSLMELVDRENKSVQSKWHQ